MHGIEQEQDTVARGGIAAKSQFNPSLTPQLLQFYMVSKDLKSRFQQWLQG